jgi:hypothetical protein
MWNLFMSISKTIEAIDSLPDDPVDPREIWNVILSWMSDAKSTREIGAGLIALAESHKRLLRATKAVSGAFLDYVPPRSEWGGSPGFDRLGMSITRLDLIAQEAEK